MEENQGVTSVRCAKQLASLSIGLKVGALLGVIFVCRCPTLNDICLLLVSTE